MPSLVAVRQKASRDMLFRKIDLAEKYAISCERLDLYEQANLLTPIASGDFVCYSGSLRVAVIAKAEQLGFSFTEIETLLSFAYGTRKAPG